MKLKSYGLIFVRASHAEIAKSWALIYWVWKPTKIRQYQRLELEVANFIKSSIFRQCFFGIRVWILPFWKVNVIHTFMNLPYRWFFYFSPSCAKLLQSLTCLSKATKISPSHAKISNVQTLLLNSNLVFKFNFLSIFLPFWTAVGLSR